jgi:hypothetical protein
MQNSKKSINFVTFVFRMEGGGKSHSPYVHFITSYEILPCIMDFFVYE